MYIYKNTIYKTNAIVIGLDVAQNTADRIDFETNHKSTATLITAISIAETAYEMDKTFQQLDDYVVSPILWSDVKYIEADDKYQLFLLSENPL